NRFSSIVGDGHLGNRRPSAQGTLAVSIGAAGRRQDRIYDVRRAARSLSNDTATNPPRRILPLCGTPVSSVSLRCGVPVLTTTQFAHGAPGSTDHKAELI